MKALKPQESGKILGIAENSTNAINAMYHQLKPTNRHLSLTVFCQSCGMNSTGYFSDILAGKRILHEKHLAGVAQGFGLNPLQTELLGLLIRRDKQKEKYSGTLETRISALKKAINIDQNQNMTGVEDAVDLHLLVLSAFSLLEGRASADRLVSLFSHSHRMEVRMVLQNLVSKGFVEPHSDADGTFVPVHNRTIFSKSTDGFSHLAFLRDSFSAALQKSQECYEKGDETVFAASLISVNKKAFKDNVNKLKSQLIELQSELENPDPDSLLRFNVQIYLEPKCKKNSNTD